MSIQNKLLFNSFPKQMHTVARSRSLQCKAVETLPVLSTGGAKIHRKWKSLVAASCIDTTDTKSCFK